MNNPIGRCAIGRTTITSKELDEFQWRGEKNAKEPTTGERDCPLITSAHEEKITSKASSVCNRSLVEHPTASEVSEP
jgi:hypothetical protein